MKTLPAYATLPHVREFIDWLAGELDSTTLFGHGYVDRRTGVHWSCSSLYDAYQGYRWKHPGNERLAFESGDTVQSNAKALAALRDDLLAADADDERVLQATCAVMAWGGVTAHNDAWLKANVTGLAAKVRDVQAALDVGDPAAAVLRDKTLRFNAGMTKVYSLICANFIIYDSRVAAALGFLVVRYCQAKALAKVPEALNFPWAGAKEGENGDNPKNRNPGVGTLRFKRLCSGSHHARWNLHASWVLSRVVSHASSETSPFRRDMTPAQSLRAIEQALFMIGYDLGAIGVAG